jgi:hypothetical protein
MAKKRRASVTSVTAVLPYSMDLTKLKAGNNLQFQVRINEELLGTLIMGRGSVEWWPRGASVNVLRKTWKAFADLLDKQVR